MLIRAKVGNFRKNPKNNFLNFFRDCFSFQKKRFEKIFLPMSIRNLLRNPKIILRTPCGQPKDAKKQKIPIYYIYRPSASDILCIVEYQ